MCACPSLALGARLGRRLPTCCLHSNNLLFKKSVTAMTGFPYFFNLFSTAAFAATLALLAGVLCELVLPTRGSSGGRAWIGTFHATCARILRREIEALEAGYTRDFSIIDTNDRNALLKSIEESAQTLSQWQLRYRVRLDTGGWSWVEGLAQPEALPDESILWHGYITNVDERQRIDEMKNQFISTVSHELRTPLTSISGSLGLILGGATGPVNEKTAQMLTIAQRNSKQLRHLIDDLLDIEKLVSGNVTFDASVQRLDEAAEAAIEEIQPMARKRGVEVQLNVLERDLYANYDIVRLTQAITNLLSNAIKFSPAGAAVRVDLSKSGDEAKLEVRDQGPGVPESFRDRIFQKFAQANSTSSRTKEGTGLGLAITRELMQAMGGEVDFESEEGSGACFWITLPLAEPGTQ